MPAPAKTPAHCTQPALASALKQPVNRLPLKRHIPARPCAGSGPLDFIGRPKSRSRRPTDLFRRIPRMAPGFTVIRDTTPAAAIPKGAVVAMGNFDGVHLGHRAVIAAALQMGRAHGRPALAVTFEPHPRSFFSPNSPQFRLTDEAGKLLLLAGTGLSGAVVMTFDKTRARPTAQGFIHHDLIERLRIHGIASGHDFHFV